jgi:hypothetical protein
MRNTSLQWRTRGGGLMWVLQIMMLVRLLLFELRGLVMLRLLMMVQLRCRVRGGGGSRRGGSRRSRSRRRWRGNWRGSLADKVCADSRYRGTLRRGRVRTNKQHGEDAGQWS